jgi:dTDP-glucose 4,6-dehydratase
MRLLITGGAGFIGSNFTRMSASGCFGAMSKIYVLDALTYSGNLKNLIEISSKANYEFIYGRIEDFKLVNSIMDSVDVVINFAAESHVDRSIFSSKEFVISNIVGTQNLLDAIRKRTNVRLIHISTDEVYGSVKRLKPNEKARLRPNSPYSASKASADLLIRSYVKTHSVDAVITRSSNNYGPHQHPEKLIPTIISKLLSDQKIPIYGTGMNVRDWIHVEDNCYAISKLIDKKVNGIFNIGSNIQITNLELAKKIIRLMGRDLNSINYVEDRKGHDFRYALSTKKYKKLVGQINVRDFESGLLETIKWYSENREYFSD